jgi:hypothetical protein
VAALATFPAPVAAGEGAALDTLAPASRPRWKGTLKGSKQEPLAAASLLKRLAATLGFEDDQVERFLTIDVQ